MREFIPRQLAEADQKRFWSKVALPDADGCMLWLAGIAPTGYGRFKMNGREGRASRASLQIAVGPPPAPHMFAAHSCRNRHCVAPTHLRWATPAENTADRIADGTYQYGERGPRAKLTREQVREIREKLSLRVMQRELATEYGVSKSLISAIARGETWIELDFMGGEGS